MSTVSPMSFDASDIRPLRIGEILDASIKITTRNFLALAKIVAITTIPIQVVSAFISISTLSEDSLEGSTTAGSELDSDAWVEFSGNIVVSLLGIVATLVALSACTRIVAGAYFGDETGWRDSLRYAARRLPALLWVGLLCGLMVAVGALGCIIPGIWLAVSYSVAIPALLIENTRGVKALKRSFNLVRRRWWPTFAVLLLGFLLINIVTTVVSLPTIGVLLAGDDPNLLVFVVLASITGVIGTILTQPFMVAMLVLVYLDLRVRKEGLDLQILAERIGASTPEAGSAPPWLAPAPGAAPPPGWAPPGPGPTGPPRVGDPPPTS